MRHPLHHLPNPRSLDKPALHTTTQRTKIKIKIKHQTPSNGKIVDCKLQRQCLAIDRVVCDDGCQCMELSFGITLHIANIQWYKGRHGSIANKPTNHPSIHPQR
jgi:hypothetical protein